MPLPIYEDYLMLHDVNITFNGRVYKNAYQLLKSLIIDRTLKMMIKGEKKTLIKDIEKKMSTK